MSTRWKDKADIVTLAAGDRMPVTDVSDANVDKYFTPAEMATYVGTTYGTTVDNAVARFDGIVGDLQSSGVSIDDSNNISPAANDGGALGTTALKWSDAFFASGAVVNFNSGDVTITHSANALAFAGATVNGYSFADGPIKPAADDGAALGVSGSGWSDLFLASGGVINWNAADVTITHSSNALAFAGATTNGYSFADGPIKPATNDGAALGISGTAWSDLFLASGAVVNFNAGDVTITHAADQLLFAGAASGYAFGTVVFPTANDGAALGTTGNQWSDLFLASGGVVNFNNGDVTLTHSADALTLAGGGLILPAGTATVAPLTLVSGTNLTAAAAGAVEYDGKAFYATAAASSRQAVNAEQTSILTADRTGTDVNTAQAVFGATEDALTLAANTTYEFEALYYISRAAGTTSHTSGVLFGGTATFTSIDFLAQVTNPTGNALANVQQIMSSAATLVTLTAANTSATENLMIWLRGTIRTNGAGAIIPQFQFSAAPGGAPTIKRNSFFRCWPIGVDTVASVGNWA